MILFSLGLKEAGPCEKAFSIRPARPEAISCVSFLCLPLKSPRWTAFTTGLTMAFTKPPAFGEEAKFFCSEARLASSDLSSLGCSISSGMSSRPSIRKVRPTLARLDHTDRGMDRIKGMKMGAFHQKKERLMKKRDAAQIRASRVPNP